MKNGNAISAEKPEHTGRVRMYTETGIFVGTLVARSKKDSISR